MTPLPKEPVGSDAFASWGRRILQCIRERTVLEGENVRVHRTVNGVRIDANAKTKAATPADVKPYKLYTIHANYLVCREYDVRTGAIGQDDIKIAKTWETQLVSYMKTDLPPTGTPGLPTFTSRQMDGYTFGMVAQDPQFGSPRHREWPCVRRSRTHYATATYDTIEEQNDFESGVSFLESVVPAYVPEDGNGNGSVIWAIETSEAAFYEAEHTLAFDPPLSPTTLPELSITKLEMPGRVWMPAFKNLQVCVDGERKRIRVRGSEYFEAE